MKENDISYDIQGAVFKVHKELGPGLLESVYETALSYELKEMGYKVKPQLGIPMVYNAIQFDIGFRLDIIHMQVILHLIGILNIFPVRSQLVYLLLMFPTQAQS